MSKAIRLPLERDARAGQQGELSARLALEAIAGHVFEVDSATGQVQRDTPLEDILGWRPDEIPSTAEGWYALIHPEDRIRTREQGLAAIAAQAPRLAAEYRVRHRNGSWVWVLTSCRLEYGSTGELRRIVGCTFDVDTRKRTELALQRNDERQALLLDISGALFAGASDEVALAESLFARLREPLRLDGCFSFRATDPAGGLQLVAAPGFDPAELAGLHELPLDNSFCGLAATSRQPVSADAARIDTDPHGRWVRERGVRAYASHPLAARDGRLLGTLSFASRSRDRFEPDEIGFLQTLCHFVSLAWERIAFERALRLSEQALAASRADLLARFEELDSLYRTAPVGLCVLDRELRWTRMNERLAEINGLPVEAHLGRRVRDVLPGIAEQVEPMLRRVLETGQPMLDVEVVGETLAQPGVQRAWSEHFHPLRNTGGEIVGISVVAEEITERRRAEDALKASDRQKDQFIAMLAHELRNPLAAIRSATEVLLRQGPGEPGVREPLAIVSRQSSQLTRLVDDLLDISRIAQGRITLRLEPLEVPALVEQAVETVAPLFREKQHLLRIAHPDESLHVRGDRARLVQAIGNILHNAAKYTQPRGDVTVQVSTEGERVVIAVTDNGAGIAAELQPRVFDLFVQSERTLDRSQGGLGIGLSVVRRLVEMHGGSVSVGSAGAGRGSTFTVKLPRIAAPTEEGRSGERQTHGRRRRVLVVDDNADSADSLAMLLKLEGHDVETVYGALAALDAAKRMRPDAVLLDIGLPHMDGLEVARRMRADSALHRTRLIALTGYGQPEDRERSRAAGFDDHLVKPPDLDALLAAIG